MERNDKYGRLRVGTALGLAIAAMAVACAVVVVGVIVRPTGEIHSSLLWLFGESSAFSAALLGTRYNPHI